MSLIDEQCQRERWCNKCDDYRPIKFRVWESSVAVIWDLECAVCREIFERASQRRERT